MGWLQLTQNVFLDTIGFALLVISQYWVFTISCFSRSAQSARVLVTLQQSLARPVLVVGFRPYSSVGGIWINHANVVFNVAPLGIGNVYLGPSLTSANTCRCSSVYYSLLSACAHCQGGSYLQWALFQTVFAFSLLRVLSDGRYTAPTVQLFTSQRKPKLLDSLR